jgi:DICT domain-containing protein
MFYYFKRVFEGFQKQKAKYTKENLQKTKELYGKITYIMIYFKSTTSALSHKREDIR